MFLCSSIDRRISGPRLLTQAALLTSAVTGCSDRETRVLQTPHADQPFELIVAKLDTGELRLESDSLTLGDNVVAVQVATFEKPPEELGLAIPVAFSKTGPSLRLDVLDPVFVDQARVEEGEFLGWESADIWPELRDSCLGVLAAELDVSAYWSVGTCNSVKMDGCGFQIGSDRVSLTPENRLDLTEASECRTETSPRALRLDCDACAVEFDPAPIDVVWPSVELPREQWGDATIFIDGNLGVSTGDELRFFDPDSGQLVNTSTIPPGLTCIGAFGAGYYGARDPVNGRGEWLWMDEHFRVLSTHDVDATEACARHFESPDGGKVGLRFGSQDLETSFCIAESQAEPVCFTPLSASGAPLSRCALVTADRLACSDSLRVVMFDANTRELLSTSDLPVGPELDVNGGAAIRVFANGWVGAYTRSPAARPLWLGHLSADRRKVDFLPPFPLPLDMSLLDVEVLDATTGVVAMRANDGDYLGTFELETGRFSRERVALGRGNDADLRPGPDGTLIVAHDIGSERPRVWSVMRPE